MPLKENNIDSVGPISPGKKKQAPFDNGLTNSGPEVTDVIFGSTLKLKQNNP